MFIIRPWMSLWSPRPGISQKHSHVPFSGGMGLSPAKNCIVTSHVPTKRSSTLWCLPGCVNFAALAIISFIASCILPGSCDGSWGGRGRDGGGREETERKRGNERGLHVDLRRIGDGKISGRGAWSALARQAR